MSELELELRELRIEWPETPDLAGAVQGRLAGAAAPRRSGSPGRPGSSPSPSVALIVAVVMAIPPARAAVLDLLGFGSVRISARGAAPVAVRPGARARRSGDARRRRGARLPVLVPEELGRPDAVYLYDHPAMGPRVDIVYRARPGLPSSSNTGAGLLITEFRARRRRR